jgi:hypothetical protein
MLYGIGVFTDYVRLTYVAHNMVFLIAKYVAPTSVLPARMLPVLQHAAQTVQFDCNRRERGASESTV